MLLRLSKNSFIRAPPSFRAPNPFLLNQPPIAEPTLANQSTSFAPARTVLPMISASSRTVSTTRWIATTAPSFDLAKSANMSDSALPSLGSSPASVSMIGMDASSALLKPGIMLLSIPPRPDASGTTALDRFVKSIEPITFRRAPPKTLAASINGPLNEPVAAANALSRSCPIVAKAFRIAGSFSWPTMPAAIPTRPVAARSGPEAKKNAATISAAMPATTAFCPAPRRFSRNEERKNFPPALPPSSPASPRAEVRSFLSPSRSFSWRCRPKMAPRSEILPVLSNSSASPRSSERVFSIRSSITPIDEDFRPNESSLSEAPSTSEPNNLRASAALAASRSVSLRSLLSPLTFSSARSAPAPASASPSFALPPRSRSTRTVRTTGGSPPSKFHSLQQGLRVWVVLVLLVGTSERGAAVALDRQDGVVPVLLLGVSGFGEVAAAAVAPVLAVQPEGEHPGLLLEVPLWLRCGFNKPTVVVVAVERARLPALEPAQ